jgi:Uma2 family endonuclease
MNVEARSLPFAAAVDNLFEDVPARMTTTEFFQYTWYSEHQHQLLNGRPIVNPAPSMRHQKISRNLYTALNQFVNAGQLGEVWYAPCDIVLDKFNVVQPDLFFVAVERARIITETNVQGAPDLVIEILSTSTADVDRGYKQHLYALHGVREYWLIDPGAQQVEVLTLAEGEFGRAGVYRQGDIVTSPLLTDFRIAVKDIFA